MIPLVTASEEGKAQSWNLAVLDSPDCKLKSVNPGKPVDKVLWNEAPLRVRAP